MSRVLLDLGEDEGGNFAAALEQIYADLGRTLHRLVPRQDAFDDDETTAVNGNLAKAMAELAVPGRRTGDLGDEPEDEPTDPGFEPPPPEPPAKKAASPKRAARQKRAEDRHAAVVATLEREGAQKKPPMAAPPSEGDGFGRAAIHNQGDVAPGTEWIERLADLLELVALPTDLTSPTELAAEASLVQWSTADLDATWAPFPPAIKAALLGLLAARARHLQDHLAVDVGPRIALERLSTYRERAGLVKVEGLYPERAPQSGTWQADAARWWETLVDGLREA